jgi:hypothetical protein
VKRLELLKLMGGVGTIMPTRTATSTNRVSSRDAPFLIEGVAASTGVASSFPTGLSIS